MLLQFTKPELQILSNILNNSGDSAAESLLDRVLRRDLRFDFTELEELADILAAQAQQVSDEIVRERDAERKQNLQNRQESLQRIRDKVTEACAMA